MWIRWSGLSYFNNSLQSTALDDSIPGLLIRHCRRLYHQVLEWDPLHRLILDAGGATSPKGSLLYDEDSRNPAWLRYLSLRTITSLQL